MVFNKRWQAKLYILWLRIETKFKHRNIQYESYSINHNWTTNNYEVTQFLHTKDMEEKLNEEIDRELNREKN